MTDQPMCAKHPHDCSVDKHAHEWRAEALLLRARLAEVEAELSEERDHAAEGWERARHLQGLLQAAERGESKQMLRAEAAEAELEEIKAAVACRPDEPTYADLLERLTAVLALHQRVEDTDSSPTYPDWCGADGRAWPCPTVRAALGDGGTQAEAGADARIFEPGERFCSEPHAPRQGPCDCFLPPDEPAPPAAEPPNSRLPGLGFGQGNPSSAPPAAEPAEWPCLADGCGCVPERMLRPWCAQPSAAEAPATPAPHDPYAGQSGTGAHDRIIEPDPHEWRQVNQLLGFGPDVCGWGLSETVICGLPSHDPIHQRETPAPHEFFGLTDTWSQGCMYGIDMNDPDEPVCGLPADHEVHRAATEGQS